MDHNTSHHPMPTDLGSLAIETAGLTEPSGSFTPTKNQLAALAYVAMERKAIRKWRMIAEAIGVDRRSVNRWRTDPRFMEWWSNEILKQQHARVHQVIDVMEEIAYDDKAARSDRLAAAKAFKQSTGESLPVVDAGLGALLTALGGKGGEVSVKATKGDTGDQLEVKVDTRERSPKDEELDDLVQRASTVGAYQATPRESEKILEVEAEVETLTDRVAGQADNASASDNGCYVADEEAGEEVIEDPNIEGLKDRASGARAGSATGGGGSKITRARGESQSTPQITRAPKRVLWLDVTCPQCHRVLMKVRHGIPIPEVECPDCEEG